LENIVDDRLEPERSTFVMSSDEYVLLFPIITMVIIFGTEIELKFEVAVWLTVIVTDPDPTMVPLAIEEFGIDNTFELLELYERTYDPSVLFVEKKSNPMLPLTISLLTMAADLVEVKDDVLITVNVVSIEPEP
jgi:hypothetical protein